MHNFGSVWIRENSKEIKMCFESLKLYAVQSFHPGKKNSKKSRKSPDPFLLSEKN